MDYSAILDSYRSGVQSSLSVQCEIDKFFGVNSEYV